MSSLLLAAGARPNTTSSFDTTPLYWAAKKRRLDILDLLFSAGASVAAEPDRELLDAGADPLLPGWMGITPLRRAQMLNEPERGRIVALLDQYCHRL